MKIINLHGVVGVHIDAGAFANELDNTTGDIMLDLNSGGGYITAGIAILNKIRSYDKGRVTARVSYAASMMTQIALAADEVQVYDNSIFMIHNALGVAMGDYREMDKRKNMLKSMSNMLAKTYVKKTGKTTNQILKMMDDETYLYGNEIIKEGFADTLLGAGSDENKTKDEAIAYSHIQMGEVSKALKNENLTLDQLSACVGNCSLMGGDENATSAFQDFPMVDQAWDGAAAVRRVRKFMGAEVKPNASYKKAFFWYNSEESENFGAYKLPFVDVVDGRLVANVRAVNAANAAMAGARSVVAIPAADRPRVQSHIDRYREGWQREQDRGGASGDAFKQDNKETKTMNLSQLRAEHQELYAEVVAVGVNQERERVTAHLTMGEASGDMELAVASINDGAEMSATLNARYMAAHMKRTESNDRNAENVPDVNTPNNGDEGDEDKAMAGAVANLLGVEYE